MPKITVNRGSVNVCPRIGCKRMDVRMALVHPCSGGEPFALEVRYARRLVRSREAVIVGTSPLAVRLLVPLLKVRSIHIPEDCKSFKSDYLSNCRKSLGQSSRRPPMDEMEYEIYLRKMEAETARSSRDFESQRQLESLLEAAMQHQGRHP